MSKSLRKANSFPLLTRDAWQGWSGGLMFAGFAKSSMGRSRMPT